MRNGEYLWFGLQPNDTAMTPNGEMYFNPSRFQEDFSAELPTLKHWFIHEMVHIWQHQLGYPVKWRGAIRIGLDYNYTLEIGRRLSAYNMEAQGDVIADFFVLKHLGNARVMSQRQFADQLATYEAETLVEFLANPASKTSLPGGDQ